MNHSSFKNWSYLKLLHHLKVTFFFTMFFALPGYSSAAGLCSPYIGMATLNEFFKDQTNQTNDPDDFAEVKILNDAIDISTYQNWSIKVCEDNEPGNNNDSDGCSATIPLSDFTDTTKPWVVLESNNPNNIGRYFNLKTGFDAVLLDENDDLIDYLTVDGYTDAISGISCNLSNLVFDYTASSPGASDKTIFRNPDGTGDWDTATAASAPPTEDDTNDNLPDPPPGETYPLVTIDDISVSTGGTAQFTISLVDDSDNPTTFNQAVTVSYYTQDGSATVADNDYAAIGLTTITISAGQTSVQVSVDASTSDLNDANEIFYLVLNAVEDSADNGNEPNAYIDKHFGVATLDGPVAEWNFDVCTLQNPGDVIDTSGNSLHGSPINGIGVTSGVVCTALSLNGTDDYVEVADNNLLDLQNQLTVMTWIRPNSIPSSGLMSILSKDENYEFHINSSGNINWWWNNSSGGTREFNSTATIPTNTWTHVAIVYEAGSQRIVINGVESGTRSYNESLITNSDPLHIGGDQLFAGREFDGLIDEVKVYNRALATNEILSYVNNPDPTNRSCPNCVASETIILSTNNTEVLRGTTITNGSLAEYNPTTDTAAPFFDESNFASGDENISAVHVFDDGSFILSTGNNATLGGLSFGDEDLVHYNPATDTATLYFDGNLFVGNADINAVYVRADGNILLSTTADATLGGITFEDGDVVEYNPTTDTATLFFDEDLFSGGADIDGIHLLDNGNILISTTNSETLGGLSFEDGDIVEYNFATDTATLYFDEDLFDGGADINALSLRSPATLLRHIQIEHDGVGITCQPETITFKACSNADCSSLFTSDVVVDIASTDGSWSSPNPVTISGGSTDFDLQDITAGVDTLSISNTSPAADNAYSCINSGPNPTGDACNIEFFSSGFIFDVPTQTSCATSSNVTVQAVATDPTTSQCVPLFNSSINPKNLKVWTTYLSPAAGDTVGTPTVDLTNNRSPAVTETLPTNGTAPVTNNIELDFDDNGEATFTVEYSDAGQIQLDLQFDGTGAEAGLQLIGSDDFVTMPAQLNVSSPDAASACASGDATCTPYVAAGDNFNLNVNATCADGTTVTRNFRINGVSLSSTLVAPIGGDNATLGTVSTNLIDTDEGNKQINNQTVSEVGVFRITATPPATYLGLPLTTAAGTSPNLGRFTPHHFTVDADEACSNIFTYSGQPLTVRLTAENAGNNPTVNYRDGFVQNPIISDPNPETPALGNFENPENEFTSAHFTANTGVGTKNDVTYNFINKLTAPEQVDLRATDSDTISSAGATEDQINVRSGRTVLDNAFGPEQSPLILPLRFEYYTDAGSGGFITNTDDSCSDYDATLAANSFANYTQNLDPGETIASGADEAINGLHDPAGPITLTTPGTDNHGSVNFILNSIDDWLKYNWNFDCDNADLDNNISTGIDAGLCGPYGTASFGLYRGDDRIIFQREVLP